MDGSFCVGWRTVLFISFFAVFLSGGSPALAAIAGQNIDPFHIPAGGSVTIEFEVTVDDPLPAGVLTVCNQSAITGANFPGPVAGDDPDSGGASDPTCTRVNEAAPIQGLVVPTLNPLGGALLALLLFAVGWRGLRRQGQGWGRAWSFLILALLLLTPSVVRAVVIDDFVDPAGSVTISHPGGNTTTDAAAAGQILGGERQAEILRFAGGGTVSADLGGGLSLTVPAGADGQLDLTYDGVGSGGLGGEDLTAGGANALRLRVNSLGAAGGEVGVEILDGSGNLSIAGRVLPAVAGAKDFFFSFDHDFVPPAGEAGAADFSSVEKIVVWFWLSGGHTLVVSLLDTIGPNPAVQKIDLDTTNGALGNTSVPPGGTIRYRITITNPGGHAADVDVTDAINANTTLAGQVRITPVAFDDAYEADATVQLQVAATASGLLANDKDPDDPAGPGSLTVTAFDAQSTKAAGANVNVAADGTFTYDPPAGFTGVDSFGYTVTDDEGQTARATVNLLVLDDPSITYTGGNWTWTPPATILTNQVPNLAGSPYVTTSTNDCGTNSTNTIRFYDNNSGRRYDATITFTAADTPHKAQLTDTAASGANYVQNASGAGINFSAPGTVTFTFSRKGWRLRYQ